MAVVISHRLDIDSSWWNVIREIANKGRVSVYLLGSAVYMQHDGTAAEMLPGIGVAAVELGYGVPSGVRKISLADMEGEMKKADSVLSL